MRESERESARVLAEGLSRQAKIDMLVPEARKLRGDSLRPMKLMNLARTLFRCARTTARDYVELAVQIADEEYAKDVQKQKDSEVPR